MNETLVMSKPEEKHIGLVTIFLIFFKMSLTAFGPAMISLH
ncbi:hypothetical protein SBF1_1260003 [Candidatus Desulfosporosinus infrequens]|uniref:Uncharacterized protein n=1 Tax=Candidatus Desulfosporosinus infrequens TaxID=2043169 RepID=A0A2U3K2C8_9FIRM|nr:hypothetical protein SBF1_1260003 [Candidatus Desulfosporosinus infrequens]